MNFSVGLARCCRCDELTIRASFSIFSFVISLITVVQRQKFLRVSLSSVTITERERTEQEHISIPCSQQSIITWKYLYNQNKTGTMRHRKRWKKKEASETKWTWGEFYASRWAGIKFEIKLCCAGNLCEEKCDKRKFGEGFSASCWRRDETFDGEKFSLCFSGETIGGWHFFIVVTFRNYFMIMWILLTRIPFNTDQCWFVDDVKVTVNIRWNRDGLGRLRRRRKGRKRWARAYWIANISI